MNEISAALCGVVLLMVALVSVGMAVVRSLRPAAIIPAPPQPVPAPVLRPPGLPAGPETRRVRVTFLSDNPWFDAGESAVGLATRRGPLRLSFQPDSLPGTTYVLLDEPEQLRIEVFEENA
ncbi:MAG TPA: hypothetical protein VFS21_15370 [Roseiflexaceae bacterium]|nr:hypothetical protein [Roseiflexaceae bacterium]